MTSYSHLKSGLSTMISYATIITMITGNPNHYVLWTSVVLLVWYRSSKLKFKTYIKKQKAIEEICKRLVVGSKKYGRGSKTGVKTATENTSIHYPNAPQDAENPPTSTVTAFGDATFYGKQSRACEVNKKEASANAWRYHPNLFYWWIFDKPSMQCLQGQGLRECLDSKIKTKSTFGIKV